MPPKPKPAPPPFFATTSRGTEEVLAVELGELKLSGVEARRGGVAFGGGIEGAYRACLWSRVASRVLMSLAEFEAEDADALYEGAHAVDWTRYLGPDQSLAVDVAGRDAPSGPPHFIALKVKDAIVDRVREAEGDRPDVDTRDPDVRINVHVAGSRVTVYLDVAGRSLHRRAGDRAGAEAPLKENLAAALVRMAGWRSGDSRGLFDPMCGSGTLLVEAAGIALDRAPGLTDPRIGAAGWRGHDPRSWELLLGEARERAEAGANRELRIAGSDVSRSAVRLARECLAQAGLGRKVRVGFGELGEIVAPWDEPGLLITNPPYGARIGESEELVPLYQRLGDVLKRRFPGWSAWVFCGNPGLAKRIGLRPAARHVLYNGPIECRLLEIPISDAPVEGSKGPGWRRPGEQSKPFAGKLRKNLRSIGPWARREKLTCYRLYDSDVPEYNLSVDWYDGAVLVCENERPRKIKPADAEQRLREAWLVVPELLGVDETSVVLRVARPAREERPGRRRDRPRYREVLEGWLKFLVDLADPSGTRLALSERSLRARVREQARDGDFLQLFAGSCCPSVAAAAGGARSTTAVDASKEMLSWGQRNFRANGLARSGALFEIADPAGWLARGDGRRYDRILITPPEPLRAEAGGRGFDVQHDHARLLMLCARALAPGGELLFVSRRKRFVFEADRLPFRSIQEITEELTPRDFRQRPPLRAWSLRDPGR